MNYFDERFYFFRWFMDVICCVLILLYLPINAFSQSLVVEPDTSRVENFRLGVIPANYNVKGMQFGAVATFIGNGIYGLNLGMNAMTRHDAHGLQAAGLLNAVGGEISGMQLSGALNLSHETNGLQVAFTNYTDSLKGVQLGAINVCRNNANGFQVGLVNFSDGTSHHKVGLVNINPQAKIDFLLFGGTINKANIALRFRNQSTYNIIGMGTHFLGLDERFSGALYYRLGQRFSIGKRFAVSGDLGFFHIETFQHNSKSAPERLYSLQARVNAECQLDPLLAVFGSVGWGATRYYSRSELFKKGFIGELGLAFRLRNYGRFPENVTTDVLKERGDSSIYVLPKKKNYWRAGVETFGLNVAVQRFDRYVLNGDYAYVSMKTIKANFHTGFVWDNDRFSCNLFSHPYHGGLYFNSARTNGLSFWESLPYAIGGSFMWETTCENEPPAINDFFATSIGGTAIGEITYRLSSLVLDDSKSGFERFWRECLSTIICPMRGLNRIIDGEAWRMNSCKYKYHDYYRFPVSLQVSAGERYLADDNALFRGENNPFVNVSLSYGDPFDVEETKPYDYFVANVTFGLSKNQPLINGIHLLGRLWSMPLMAEADDDFSFGLFHHFNYFDSEAVKDGTSLVPYRISEAAAVGPGLNWAVSDVSTVKRLEQGLYLDGIILGGSLTDYLQIKARDYNMGSGWSFKSKTMIDFGNVGRFNLNADYYKIYTWKGYECRDLANMNPNYINTQGDIGNAALMVLSPKMQFRLSEKLSLQLSGSHYWRFSHYKHNVDVKTRTYEVNCGLVWNVFD